ncbi:hypothetical protein ACLB0R_04135 [Sphingomonas sp. GlSt437]
MLRDNASRRIAASANADSKAAEHQTTSMPAFGDYPFNVSFQIPRQLF